MTTKPYHVHVRPVTRKCSCGSKQTTYSTGEYIRGKWQNIQDVCPECVSFFVEKMHRFEIAMKRPVVLVGYHCDVPDFLARSR